MAKIIRYTGNFGAFAKDSLTDERTVFNALTTSDTLDGNMTSDYFRGWGVYGANDKVTRQDMNAMGYTLGQALAYLHQMGVAEYDSAQEYHEDSIANESGVLYRSLSNSNTGNLPSTSPSDWEPISPGAALTANITVTVGSGGDYATLNAALAAVTAAYFPIYVSGGGVRVTINMLTGFTMAEQVIADGIDLSWITITGDDASTTITRSALTSTGGGYGGIYPAFGTYRGRGPTIEQSFTMDTSGTATNRCFFFSGDNGSIKASGTFTGAPIGAYSAAGGVVIGGSFPSSINEGIRCEGGGRFENFNSAIDVSGSGYGIFAEKGSYVNATGGVDASGCTTSGVFAREGSRINFNNGNAQKGGSPAATDIVVETGSIIQANGATGGLSVTANTVTSDGIIFQ